MKTDINFIVRFLSYLMRYKTLFFLSVFLIFVDIIAEIITPFIIRKAVDNAIHTGNVGKIFVYSGVIFGIISLSSITEFLVIYLTNKVGQSVLHDIRCEIFGAVMRIPMKFFDRTQTGKIVIRITNDVENLNELFVSGLITFFADILIILGVIAVMFLLDVRLALITLSTFPFMLLITLVFRKRAGEIYLKIRRAIAELNSFMTEAIKGVKTIKVLPAYIFSSEKFRVLNLRYFDVSGKSIHLFSFFFSSIIFFSSLSLAGVIWYGGGKIIDGEISFGTFLAFWYAVNKLFDPIWDFSEKYNIIQSATASAKRIFELLEEEKEGEDKEKKGRYIKLIDNSVEFRNVYFSYDGQKYVLKGASFFIPSNSTVSIVGLTGAGKTTIANLLTGLYKYEKGEILIGGRNIKEIPLPQLRQKVSYVSQDIFIFKGKVIDNIVLWSEKNYEKLNQIKRIIDEIGIELSLEREVGEKGHGLSAGEKQIISILRAIYFNTSIIILDEATAFVDFEMEEKIDRILDKLKGSKTIIKIAHRLSTVKNSDKIIAVEEGKIKEIEGGAKVHFYASIYNNR